MAGEVKAEKLEALRVAGETSVEPPQTEPLLTATVKVCLTRKGKDTWLYRPFMVNGVATPVCAAITLIYVQKPPKTP